MDLIYLYAGNIGRNVGDYGIEFSRMFDVVFDNKTGKLNITRKEKAESKSSIYGRNIHNIDLLVGKNGSGKSTTLSLLGLSRNDKIQEFIAQTHNNDELFWFALYYIEDDRFAIEGYRCEAIEFIRDGSYAHFQNMYSLSFKYDFVKQTGYNPWPLQELWVHDVSCFHKKLFFLYFENPVTLEWVKPASRSDMPDMGSSYTFERIKCERMGYRGIMKFLYDAYNDDAFMRSMGIKPGTDILISVDFSENVSFFDRNDLSQVSDIVHSTDFDVRVINPNAVSKYLYGGELLPIENVPIYFKNILGKHRIINNNLNYKEAFVIAFLEQIAISLILHRINEIKSHSHGGLKFKMPPKTDEQTQYEWQYNHLLSILQNLLGKDARDYMLISEIANCLETIPSENFAGYAEIQVALDEMSVNFLDSLMKLLDENSQKDDIKINVIKFLKTEFKGISSGEARMIDVFAALYNSIHFCNHSPKDTCVLLLDEPDLGFHPEWSRVFIDCLTKFLKSKTMSAYNYHVIIATHSPILLSDVPKQCIHCIFRNSDGRVEVRSSDKYGLISGINDVLIDTFFTDSLFGSFGEKYANKIIKKINKLENTKQFDTQKKESLDNECRDIEGMIENLGEGYIKDALHRSLNRQRNRIKRYYSGETND